MRYRVKINEHYYDEFMKDCPGWDFVPTVVPAKKRIIVIGDVHGDYKLTIDSFKLARLIDNKMEWIAEPKDTVVVQVGDQVDSCRPIPGVHDCHNTAYAGDRVEDVKVLEFFDMIHKKAQAQGGAVYSLIGNHELMNAQGDFDYVSYANFHQFEYTPKDPDGREAGKKYTGSNGRELAFKQGGPLARNIACTRPSILIVGSNMFVHAGLLPKIAKQMNMRDASPMDRLHLLNEMVRKWLLNQPIPKDDEKTLILNRKDSPFWTRVYGKIPKNVGLNEGDCAANVRRIRDLFKIGKIMVGHTPQPYVNADGINGTCYKEGMENTLYRVDGGFSRGFKVFGQESDMVQVLEITDDTKFKILSCNPTKDVETSSEGPLTSEFSETEMKKVASIFSKDV